MKAKLSTTLAFNKVLLSAKLVVKLAERNVDGGKLTSTLPYAYVIWG